MTANNYPLHACLLFAFLASPALAADDAETAGKEPPECKYCPDYSGWSGWVEAGIGYQDQDDYHFGRYTGEVDEGFLVNADGEVNYRNQDGTFVEGQAEDLGIDARRVWVEGGRQGRYSIGLEYDRIPNYRERSSFSPFRERGDLLDLPSNWVAGPTTDQMPELGGALHRVPLKTQRDRYGANFSFIPQRRWELTGYARREEKTGTKDMGASFGFDQAVILPVPFEYETDEFGLSLEYVGQKLQSQFSYMGSLFNNDADAIQWSNPYENAASDTARGQMAEYPDNQFHQFSALFGYQLRDDTRLGLRLSRGRMTQDENYLPYTVNPGLPQTELPASSLDATVDTTLAAFDVNSRPTRNLSLDGSYTYSDRDNKTDSRVYDYVVADSGPGGMRRNAPYSYKQRLLRLKAAYRFPKDVNFSVGYDDDQRTRSYVQIEDTHDKTGWAKLRLRPLDSLEATLKYAYADRDGSDYVPLQDIDPLLENPNPNFYENPLMRVVQLADRKRNTTGLLLTYTPVSRLSLGFDIDYSKDDYDSDYLGLQEASNTTYTASGSYLFSEDLSTTLYYTHEELKSDQKGSEKQFYDDPEHFWVMSDEYKTDTVGLGVNWQGMDDKLRVGADLTYAEYSGDIEFSSGQALPDTGSKLTALDMHATYRLSDQLSLGARLRYEDYEEDDWTKDGYVDTLPNLLSLGTAPQDQSTLLGYVSVRYQF
jgi:MtrB/PioB family decaheme-associated outer membrane protein